jgi:hypothetical protein
MRKFNPFRSKQNRESSHKTKTTTTTLKNHSSPHTITNTNNTTPIQPFTISAPIINRGDKVAINDKDQPDENPNEEQTTFIESDNNEDEEEIVVSEDAEKMSDEYDCTDDQVD